jgi:protease I
MTHHLTNKKVAILVTDGFEQVEMTKPREALERAGARTILVAPGGGQVRGWRHKEWGDTFKADAPLEKAQASDFDALVLPGGVMNPDKLRMNETAVSFVRAFVDDNKPVAAICHGPWTLIEADAVDGRRMTSWPSLMTDLENAGADWVDEEVVVDRGLVTSRGPDDLPAFCERMIEEIAESRHPGREAEEAQAM